MVRKILIVILPTLICIYLEGAVNAQTWTPKQVSLGNFYLQGNGISPTSYFYDFCNYEKTDCYVFGGVDATGNSVNTLFRAQSENITYDSSKEPSVDSWFDRQMEPFPPSARSGGKMVLQVAPEGFGYGVLYGGTDGSGVILSDMFIFSLRDSKWFTVTVPNSRVNTPVPLTCFGMTSSGIFGQLYLFFGVSSLTGLSDAVYRVTVDVEAGEMTTFVMLSPAVVRPEARMGACCVFGVSRNVTMCFGGYNNFHSLRDTWLFWHNNESWTTVNDGVVGSTTSISPRFDALGTFFNGNALLYGGFTNSRLAVVEDDNVYQFSFTTLSWSVFVSTKNISHRGAGTIFVSYLNTYGPPALQIAGGFNAQSIGDRWYLPLNSSTLKPAAIDFSKLESSTPVPSARAHHSTAVVGPGFVVAFGRGSNGPVDDVYYYYQPTDGDNSSLSTWQNVDTSSSSVTPRARYGAAACSQGSKVYFYGGYLETALTLTNELWSLTVDISSLSLEAFLIQGTWQLLFPVAASNADPNADSLGRAFHGIFFAYRKLYVVGGVTGDNSVSKDVKIFDLDHNAWKPVLNNLPQAVAGFALYFDGFDTAYVVGGWNFIGIGSQRAVVSHGYMIILTSQEEVLLTTFNLGEPVYRAYAGTAGSQTTLLLCGGATFESERATLGPIYDQSCGVIGLPSKPSPWVSATNDIASVVWVPMQRDFNDKQLNVSTVGGSAIMLGSTFLYFGGAALRGMAPMQSMYSDAIYSLDLNNSLCSSTAGGNCLMCSQGTFLNMSSPFLNCTYASPGTYTINSWETMPCSRGTYSNISGAASAASCELCPNGTFANVAGMQACLPCDPIYDHCPIGSISPNTSVIAWQNTSSFQPFPLVIPATPTVLYIVVGSLVGALLLLIGLLSRFAYNLRMRHVAYFLNDDADQELRALYVANKRAHFGLDVQHLGKVLKHIGLRDISPDLVLRLLAEHDEDGTCHVTFTQFKELVVYLIERGLLKPYPNTRQATDPGRSLKSLERRIVRFSFKDLDIFETNHSLGSEGEAVRVYKTRSGGAARIVYNVLVLAAIVFLGQQFITQNIQEIRTMSKITNEDAGLVERDRIINISVAAVSSTMHEQLSCNYYYHDARTSTCNISLDPASSDISVSFVFRNVTLVTALIVTVSSDTGIVHTSDSTRSTVTTSLYSPNQDLVFCGYPKSYTTFNVMSTRCETVENVALQLSLINGGFEVQDGGSYGIGNYNDRNITGFCDIPIDVNIHLQSDQVMLVTQTPQISIPTFISQMLGTFPGIAAVLITLMQMFDSHLIKRRRRKLQLELMSSALEARGGGALNVQGAKRQEVDEVELSAVFLGSTYFCSENTEECSSRK